MKLLMLVAALLLLIFHAATSWTQKFNQKTKKLYSNNNLNPLKSKKRSQISKPFAAALAAEIQFQ